MQQANLAAYFHTITLMQNVKQRSCEYLIPLVWLDEGIEFRFTDYEADALTLDNALVRAYHIIPL